MPVPSGRVGCRVVGLALAVMLTAAACGSSAHNAAPSGGVQSNGTVSAASLIAAYASTLHQRSVHAHVSESTAGRTTDDADCTLQAAPPAADCIHHNSNGDIETRNVAGRTYFRDGSGWQPDLWLTTSSFRPTLASVTAFLPTEAGLTKSVSGGAGTSARSLGSATVMGVATTEYEIAAHVAGAASLPAKEAVGGVFIRVWLDHAGSVIELQVSFTVTFSSPVASGSSSPPPGGPASLTVWLSDINTAPAITPPPAEQTSEIPSA